MALVAEFVARQFASLSEEYRIDPRLLIANVDIGRKAGNHLPQIGEKVAHHRIKAIGARPVEGGSYPHYGNLVIAHKGHDACRVIVLVWRHNSDIFVAVYYIVPKGGQNYHQKCIFNYF